MSASVESVIVVGASAAGISCVRQLRKGGFAGSITLIDKDENGAYERPPLSKQVLMAPTTTAQDILLIEAAELDELNVTTLYGNEVVELKTQSREVTLASGETLSADAIVLATGGEARRLPIEGADLPEVLVLRHYADAVKLREFVKPGAKLAVIGGGFIGAETAASLAKLAIQVEWLDAAPLPLAHLLPEALCEELVKHHLDAGVNLTTNCRISKFTNEGNAAVTIEFTNGDTLEVDAIVLGVGMLPQMPFITDDASKELLLSSAGGITVDETLATRIPGIYAAGDVAAVTQTDSTTTRHEHWQSAQYQGELVAATILGTEAPEEPTHWFWSDQGDLHIEMAGHMLPQSECLVKREESDWPVYFSVKDNRVIGAVSVNNPNAVRVALRMIKNNVNADPEKLADPAVSLRAQMRG